MNNINQEKAPLAPPIFKRGQIICHFKYWECSLEDKKDNKYMYKVLKIGRFPGNNTLMIAYQALYKPFNMHVRPLSMARDRINKHLHPDARQTYRFEIWSDENELQRDS